MKDVIDLSMNEGEAPPGECFDVLERIGPGILRKYADPRPLEAAYAAWLGTGPANVLATMDRLGNSVGEVRGFVEYVRSRRERLAEVLRDVGGIPEPSQTNFVLASFPDARWIQRGMAAQGVLVRYFAHLPEYVRITVPRDDLEFRSVERALACLNEPEALLFDMDGVLADVRRSYREAIVQTCAAFGVEAGHDLINAVKSAGSANDDWAVTQGVLAGAGVEASLAEVTACFEELYQGSRRAPGLRRHETLIPSRELLEELARSFKLGVVTGRPHADAERFLGEQGVRGCFSAVVCREDGPLKPDPAPVRIALERLGARTAWMLGDTPDDVGAAVGAGVVPVGVVPPGGGKTVWAALEAAGAARIVDADAEFGGLFNG